MTTFIKVAINNSQLGQRNGRKRKKNKKVNPAYFDY